jgi:hypothetical protein
MLANAFRPRVPARNLDDAADAFLSVVQGIQLAPLTPARRRRVLRYALRKLIGEASSPT